MTPIENITFAEALEDYICSKDRLLSPSTVRGYRTMQRSSFDRINDLQISELTEKVIQRWVFIKNYQKSGRLTDSGSSSERYQSQYEVHYTQA